MRDPHADIGGMWFAFHLQLTSGVLIAAAYVGEKKQNLSPCDCQESCSYAATVKIKYMPSVLRCLCSTAELSDHGNAATQDGHAY